MLRIIFFVLCGLAASTSYARGGYGYFCLNLADQVNSPITISDTNLAATLIENGKLHIYDAPNLYCKMKNVSVIKDDVLAVYKSYDGWVNVKYIDKAGNVFMGWVMENRINEISNMASIHIPH